MELLTAYSNYRCYYLADKKCLVQQWLASCSSDQFRSLHLATYETYCRLSCLNIICDLTLFPSLSHEDAAWVADAMIQKYVEAGLNAFRVVIPADNPIRATLENGSRTGVKVLFFGSLSEVLSDLS